MACHAMMKKKPVTVSPEDSVNSALELMKKEKTSYVAVVEKGGVLVGSFSYEILFKNLLPVSLTSGDGLMLDITIKAAPGIAKRLKKIENLKVSDLMERKVHVVGPGTPTWEGVGILVQYGAPLYIVEPETNKLVGVIDGLSAYEELNRLKDSDGQ